ncbi:MAG: type II toxin-antitoxin system RelE family toxin [Solirubrobacteraceae bacterium]
MSAEAWSVEFERRAEKDLNRLDPPVKKQVLDAIDRLALNPHDAPLRKLTGRPQLRLRVRDWRLFVRLDHDTRTILVERILPRGRAYDR